MKTFEINGNLLDEDGLGKNYSKFENTICNVRNYYIDYLGAEFMNSLDLYVDNATSSSGYTPIITPILNKYLTIKLGITPECGEAQIAYQFAHELMHFVYFVKYGLGKDLNNFQEESICSAASLIIVRDLYPERFDEYNKHLKKADKSHYRKGTEVAAKVNYQFEELLKTV